MYMSETVDPISYYDSIAETFAKQASDKNANLFEYDGNMPSLLKLSDQISGNVLDYGCGAGNFTDMFSRDDRFVDGCDTSPHLVDIAREHYPAINFYNASKDGSVGLDKEYDLIVAKLVFHYVANLDATLASLSDNLRIGGHLLFSVPHPDKTQKHFSSEIDEGTYVDEVGQFGLTLPMVHRSLGRLSTLLANNDFSIVKTDIVYDKQVPKRLNVLAVRQLTKNV